MSRQGIAIQFGTSVLTCITVLATLEGQNATGDLARSLLKELIEINTTASVGDNTAAAEAIARRLRAGGFSAADVEVVVPVPKKGNLVARLRGTGREPPVLFLAHLDVVEARREDWTVDPFALTEKDEYFYGRGTQDIKGEAALLVANFIRLKREGFRPDRDLILALTADEELGGGGSNGVVWLLEHRRPLIDSAFCVNTDAGQGQAKGGHKLLYGVQAAEKGHVTFTLTAKNPGGHSSLPVRENAIYELSEALLKIRDMQFPLRLSEVTRKYFERTATLQDSKDAADRRAVAKDRPNPAAAARLSANPYENALLRTTCVATMLTAGHAENALPQTAKATVNCRIIPGETSAEVKQRLQQTVGSRIQIDIEHQMQPSGSPPSATILNPIEKLVQAMWPGVPVVPILETGGSDGRSLRPAGIPTYGMTQMFYDLDDNRAHGQDERIRTRDFYDGLEFGYRLLKEIAHGL
jgi:acetylornithine deacetylase/succinyl-diaminopimelate desuccinylase-like protein